MIAWPKVRLDIQVFAAFLRCATADGLALHRMRSQSAVMTKRLPHGDQAILDMRKIEDYCLNPLHPRGRHKAGYSARSSIFSGAMHRGCAALCSKPHVPPKPSGMGRTPGGHIGASMRTSGDKERVLW